MSRFPCPILSLTWEIDLKWGENRGEVKGDFGVIMGDLIKGDFQNQFRHSLKLLKYPLCLDNVFLFFKDVTL